VKAFLLHYTIEVTTYRKIKISYIWLLQMSYVAKYHVSHINKFNNLYVLHIIKFTHSHDTGIDIRIKHNIIIWNCHSITGDNCMVLSRQKVISITQL